MVKDRKIADWLLFEHSSLWDLKPDFSNLSIIASILIWTFFPMGFETAIIMQKWSIYRKFEHSSLWDLKQGGINHLQLLFTYLNILPYGIWNKIFRSLVLKMRWFEHSSLWDLKRLSVLSLKIDTIFEHSSLWDLKPSAKAVGTRKHKYLNILPYGIWNVGGWGQREAKGYHLNILPYGIWNLR